MLIEQGRPSIDPRILATVRSGLSVVADAMGITVIRAAYSTNLKGGADVSSGLFEVNGRLAALSETSLVGHLAPLRSAVGAILSDFPASEMEPGDVFMMNDPYRGGVHSNDIQIFVPVFLDGVVGYLAGTMVHVADLGGLAAGGLSGTATDIFQEGVNFPPVRLHKAGQPVRDIYNIIAANTRTPEVTIGDIRALTAGATAGARELLALIARLGEDGPALLKAAIDGLVAYTEEKLRIRIDELGDISASGEGTIDDDGVRLDVSMRVRVTITTANRGMTIDFTGTDPQAHGPINAPEGPAVSAAIYGALLLLDEPDLPINEGVFAPFDIIRPRGSLVAPLRPAAVNARGVVTAAMLDAMLDALVSLDPRQGYAGSGINHVMTVSMTDNEGVARTFHDRDYGGAGARTGADGVDAHGYAFFAGRANVPSIEMVEREHAVRYLYMKLRHGSGGEGHTRGGRGVAKSMCVLKDATVTVRTDKVRYPPGGAAGGEAGEPGGWVVNMGRDSERWLRSKETNVSLRAGDTFTMLTSGGGGFGPVSAEFVGGAPDR